MRASRRSLGTVLWRGLRLRCPRCGNSPLFRSYFRMNTDCPACGFHFERDPGYFLGSVYLNYGLTALTMTVAYVLLHLGLGVPNRVLLPPLLAWCIGFPLVFFRFARALWLAMDCYFDDPDRALPAGDPWPPNPDGMGAHMGLSESNEPSRPEARGGGNGDIEAENTERGRF